MVAIEVKPEYGYTIICSTIVPYIGLFVLGGQVMAARKKFDVQYPNLYGTPGYHKNADAFNNVQRGHQAALEHIAGVMAMCLVGGIKHPLACAAAGLLWTAGRFLFMMGYSSGPEKRYAKGAVIMWVGVLTAIISCGKLSFDLITSK